MGHSPNQQSQSVTVTAVGVPSGATQFVTAVPHTYYPNQPVILGGTTAPTGFTLGTTYYANIVDDLTFTLSATPGGPAIVGSSAGSAVTVGMPSGTYRILRVYKMVEEQWLTGQASASAAKAYAKNPATGTNQNQYWKRRKVMQYLGNPSANVPYEDEFEYVVSGYDDGT